MRYLGAQVDRGFTRPALFVLYNRGFDYQRAMVEIAERSSFWVLVFS